MPNIDFELAKQVAINVGAEKAARANPGHASAPLFVSAILGSKGTNHRVAPYCYLSR